MNHTFLNFSYLSTEFYKRYSDFQSSLETWKGFNTEKAMEYAFLALRIYNCVAAVFTFIQYFRVPRASATEFFSGITTHLYMAVLSPDAHSILKVGAVVLNPYRICDLFSRAALRTMTTPYFWAMMEMGSHSVNLISIAAMMMGQKNVNSNKKKGL